LANYAWLFAAITVVFIVAGIFASIPQLLTNIALSSDFNLFTPSAYYYDNPVGLAWGTTSIIMASFFVSAIMVSMAVGLLKDKHKRGWDITFWAYMISMVCYTLGGLMTMNVVILGWAAVEAVIGGYLLFEVRDHFVVEVTSKKQLSKVKA